MSEYRIIQPPPVVGRWVISDSFYIHVTKRPNWLHQVMARIFFGWKWEHKT